MRIPPLFVCILFFFCSPAAQAQSAASTVKFSPQEIDQILVLKSMGSREEDTRRLAAVAYTVHNGQALLIRQGNKDRLSNPAAPHPVYERDTQIILAGPTGSIYPLDEIAKRKATQLDGYSLRGSFAEEASDFAVDAVVLGASRKYPFTAGTVKLLYPPVKKGVARLVDRSPRAPNFDREFTMVWAAWAYDQARKGTPEGLALAPFVLKYQGFDPKNDNSLLEPVQKAADRLLIIKGSKTANEALAKLHDLEGTQAAILDGIQGIREQLSSEAHDAAAAASAAKSLAERVRPVDDVAASLQLTSYLYAIAGNNASARTVAGLANAANGVSNLMQNAGKVSPIALASGYVGVAIAVYSALQSSNEPASPFPALFEMLTKISEQIETLKIEISNSIASSDARLGAKLEQVSVSVNSATFTLSDIQRQIFELRELVDDIETTIRQQFIANSDLILRAEDRNCFRITGEFKLLPLNQKEFINCRDVYTSRATEYAFATASPSIPTSISTALNPQALFPFADNYEALRIATLGAQGGGSFRIANPAIWFRSTTLLVALLKASNSHLRDVAREQLAPVIEAGVNLRDFTESVAVSPSQAGSKIKSDRFEAIINQIYALQNDVLAKVETRLENAPVSASVPDGPDQTPNIDARYQMLAPSGLRFCDGIAPSLKSIENVGITRDGGNNGTDELLNQTKIDTARMVVDLGYRWGDLRSKVEATLKQFDFRTLRFDKSLIRAIDKNIVLMEQVKHQNAEMSYCINKFDITRLNMSHQTDTIVNFEFGIKVFLTVRGKENNPTFLVQELFGSSNTITPFYHLYRNGTPRADKLIQLPWEQMQGKFDKIFKPVPNTEADANLAIVKETLISFFNEQQGIVYTGLISATSKLDEEIRRLRSKLLILSSIGLNANHFAVRRWLKVASDTSVIPTAEDTIGSIVLRGLKLDAAHKLQSENNRKLLSELATLASYDNLAPTSDAISYRISDLQKLLARRSTLPAR